MMNTHIHTRIHMYELYDMMIFVIFERAGDGGEKRENLKVTDKIWGRSYTI